MADNRVSRGSLCDCLGGNKNELYCIEADRILDSCKDRDCFENTRVFLTDFGNEMIERTSTVRVKCATVVYTSIHLENVQFNRGFYAVCIRFYVKLDLEACIGGRPQDFDGVAVLDKRVILFGGESNVHTFKSSSDTVDFCAQPELMDQCSDAPTAIVQLVDPIILSCAVVEEACKCHCICSCCDIPSCVCGALSGNLCDADPKRFLTVSLGIFSVVRITRPAQYLIQATEYCVPDKECMTSCDDDPCSVFRGMAFPTKEFCPTNAPLLTGNTDSGKNRCGCS